MEYTAAEPVPKTFNFFKKLKQLVAPIRSGFVFDLFLESKVPKYYKKEVLNTLTQLELTGLNTVDAVTIVHNVGIVEDIPDYLQVHMASASTKLKTKTLAQYQGYLVDLRSSTDVNAYLTTYLSSRNRKNLRSKQRKLEETYPITYMFYYGDISREEYDYLFDCFYTLLETRFHEKKMYNKNLVQWNYYYEVAYPLILNKTASLFVIYNANKPITLTLNFHKRDIVFSAIQTYDVAFSSYNMGDISMLKHLDWCKKNEMAIFDLSKGVTDYKVKWCNHTYTFYYQLFYNPKSLLSVCAVHLISLKLRLKQYLRDKNIIGKWFQYDKFFYKRQIQKLKDYNWKDPYNKQHDNITD